MTRVLLHPLPGSKRAGELAGLVERLYAEGRRLVVWVADDGRRQALDDFLWTCGRLSFIPHRLWTPALGEVEDPVVLVGEESNPNGSRILVVGDDLPPEAWAAEFDEVYDLVPDDDDGRQRRERWAATGLAVEETG
jgi:DNA polymerase IIIc chi subunit